MTQYVEENRKLHPHHHKKKLLVLKIFLSLLILLVIGMGAFLFGVYRNVENTFSASYTKINGTTPVNFKKSLPFTTLLLETSTINGKDTDLATVLASTNPKTKVTTFMNFPVTDDLPTHTTISQTYTSGGQIAVLKEVKSLLNLPVNKVVQVNIDKIGEIIEAIGGVSLQNPKAFISSGYEFKQGTIQLTTNTQTKAYLTKVDASDQEALITRIQNVSMALYSQLQNLVNIKNIKSFSYYQDVLNSFSGTVKTNVSFNEFKTIALNYNQSLRSTSKLNLHSTTSNGISSISSSELSNVKKLFEKSLK